MNKLSRICRKVLSNGADAECNLEKVIFITDNSGFVNNEWKIEISKKRKKILYWEI